MTYDKQFYDVSDVCQ